MHTSFYTHTVLHEVNLSTFSMEKSCYLDIVYLSCSHTLLTVRGSQKSQIFLQSSMENSFRISLRTLGYIIAYCKNYWRKNAIFCYFAASSFSPVLKLKRFNKEVSKLNNLNYKIPSVAKYRFTNLPLTLELFFLLNSTRNRLRERVKVLKVTRL